MPNNGITEFFSENATVLEQQNNKKKLQNLEARHITNIQPKLKRINFETSANILKCLSYQCYLYKQIRKGNITQHNTSKAHSYKVVMYIKLHHFCNISSPDDGLKSGQKVLGK